MEEVPASPESMRQRKPRRKTNYFKRRKRASLISDKNSTNNPKCLATGPDSSVLSTTEVADTTESEVNSAKQTDINLLYFNDDGEIEFVDEDPLAAAKMLEKANEIELDRTVQHSEEFLINIRHKFVKIKDLLEPEKDSVKVEVKQEAKISSPKKANYSYTQFDLNTEMLGVCEAADILASCPSSNPKQVECEKVPEASTSVDFGKPRWSNIRKCSFSRDCATISHSSRINDLKYMIVTDFSDDETETQTNLDYSKIKSARLRQRLKKIQCDIDSPPQSVNKSSIRRTYASKKQSCSSARTPVAVRRLSYGNKESSSDDEIESFESLEIDSGDEKPQETTCNSDYNLVSSFLIKENLRQLSQIFSRSSQSQADADQDSDSLNREPPFNGFPPEPASPISLPPSESNESLHTLNIDWLFRSDSESERENGFEMEEHSSDGVHRLLDDDDEFLAQLNSSPKKEFAESEIGKTELNEVEQTVAESTEPISAERYVPRSADAESDRKTLPSEHGKTNNSVLSTSAAAGFQTASGSTIRVSEKALATARSIWAAEETKFNVDEHRKIIPEEDTCAFANPDVVPPFVGFSTAVGSTITISKGALEKSKALWKKFEEPSKDEMVSNKAPAKKNEVSSFIGFSTARGRTLTVSEDALERANTIWNECEDSSKNEIVLNEALMKQVEFPETLKHALASNETVPSLVGFSTAGGRAIAVSKDALEKAKALWNNFDDSSTDELDSKKEEVPPFIGFSTAGGNRITVSKNALEKLKPSWNNFQDSSEDDIALNEVLAKKDEFHNESLKRFSGSTVPPQVPPFVGFSTAGGSTIAVSEDALERGKTLWNIVEESDEKTSNQVFAKKVEFRNEKLKRGPDDDCDPKTPSKRFKPNGAGNVTYFSTSTPNFPLKGPLAKGQQSDEIVAVEQFFADLDDQEFQQMLCDNETVSANSHRTRQLKQVRLMNRFEESNLSESNLSGVVQWDDSFGDVVANLSPGVMDGLKPALYILEARKHARQFQMEYIKTKPESERKPRLCAFVEKKLQSERCTIQKFVGNCKPVPADVGIISEQIRMLTAENVAEFKFDMTRLYGRGHCLENIDGIPIGDCNATVNLILDEHCQAGLLEISSAFLTAPGIDPILVPEGWIENAWKWIVLKLSAMERNLSAHFHAITTPDNVYNQLLYRYHMEINCVKRSVIRKMLEKDDIPSKRMVLFVSRVFRSQNPFEAEIELSDGWYAVRTIVDHPLTLAICKGTIAVGTKLMIQGAELLNLTEGCTPFEVPSDVRLRIHANSTRRTKWFCKLGLYKVPCSFLISCNNILDNGGLVTRLQVIVIRVYPVVYLEKTQNDNVGSVLRSERAERRCSQANNTTRFENFQMLFDQIQKEVEAERVEKHVHKSKSLLYKSTSTTELLELIDAGLDISCIEIDISTTQREAIAEHQRRKQEECTQEINRRVKKLMNNQNNKRNITPLLKVRVMDARTPDKILVLSIWRPPENLTEIIQERNLLEIGNAKASGTCNGELRLTAGTSCTYNRLSGPQIGFPVEQFRKLTTIAEINLENYRPLFNEIDTIGIVIEIGNVEAKNFQMVYIADMSTNLLCVNFWSSIKEFAYEDVVKQRNVLCISNLKWRPANALSVIPNAFASEVTTFNESSKAEHFVDELRNFHSSLGIIDTESFYNECCQKIHELKGKKLPRTSNCNTPVLQHRNHHETSSSVDCSTPSRSALSCINSIDKNRTDFSHSGRQTESLQKRKIEQLSAAYKSPPKLSPIVMRSNPRVRKSFKNPARLDSRIETHRDDTLE